MTADVRVVEVLPEPGRAEIVVTFEDDQAYQVRYAALLGEERYAPLNLKRVRAAPTTDGTRILWPGGVSVDAVSVREAPHGPVPLDVVRVTPAARRWRPLYPWLALNDPPASQRCKAAQDAPCVARLLGLRVEELTLALHAYPPPEVALPRLHDLGCALAELFGSSATTVLRRPWPPARAVRASDPLVSMLDAIKAGRPDLVERPLLRIATGDP